MACHFHPFSFLPVENTTSTWSPQHHRVKTANQLRRLFSAMAPRITSSHRPWTTKRPLDSSSRMCGCTDRRGSARTRDTGKNFAGELTLSSRLKSIYNNPQNVHARRVVARPDDDDSADAAGGSASHGHRQSDVIVSDANNAAANESDWCRDATCRLKSRAEVSESCPR
jgi:hypothetical protein